MWYRSSVAMVVRRDLLKENPEVALAVSAVLGRVREQDDKYDLYGQHHLRWDCFHDEPEQIIAAFVAKYDDTDGQVGFIRQGEVDADLEEAGDGFLLEAFGVGVVHQLVF